MKIQGGFMFMFIIGFILCVIGGVAWLRKEDNGFSRLANGVASQNKTIARIEQTYDKIIVDYVAQQAANRVISETQTTLLNKMQMLEMRMDAIKQQPIVMPHKVSLQIDKPLEMKWPERAVQVIYREGPPAKLKSKPLLPKQKPSLIERSGIAKEASQ